MEGKEDFLKRLWLGLYLSNLACYLQQLQQTVSYIFFSSLLIPLNLSYFEIDEVYLQQNMLRQNCNHSSSATQNTINFCEKSQSIIAGTIIMYIYNTTENRNINLLSNPYALLPRVFRHYSKSPLQQQWVIPLSCFESYSFAIWLWWFEIRTNSSKTILIIPFS